MRRWMLAGAAVAVVPVLWWAGRLPATDAPKPTAEGDRRPHVEVERPRTKTLHRVLQTPGEVLPDQQAGIDSRVQGYIEAAHVDRGSWVEAKAPLVKIAVPDLDAKLARQKAELALCAPSRARDEATLAWRKPAFERLEELQAKSPNLVNLEMLEEARGRYQVAKAELDLTIARETVLHAQVAETQAMVDLATIVAPFAGVITKRWADPGEMVQPGTTKILQLVKVDPVRVRIAVPEVDVCDVRPDSEAEVTIDELPGWKVRQKIARLFWALDRATKTMYVELDLANPDRKIRPGMFSRAHQDHAAALADYNQAQLRLLIQSGSALPTARSSGGMQSSGGHGTSPFGGVPAHVCFRVSIRSKGGRDEVVDTSGRGGVCGV